MRRKNGAAEIYGPIALVAFFGALLVGMVVDVAVQGGKPG
jgi:hypothetical protein